MQHKSKKKNQIPFETKCASRHGKRKHELRTSRAYYLHAVALVPLSSPFIGSFLLLSPMLLQFKCSHCTSRDGKRMHKLQTSRAYYLRAVALVPLSCPFIGSLLFLSTTLLELKKACPECLCVYVCV